ncbi:MAG: tripartite tricarboxylate transporter TctB family protein [Proteobacteria bacterium]|nr:tripartite tricarboxylate transporter TctB family protein [Pseudomonadota bacterium]MCK4866678.1 tripartite tricarboxylate transporter TctB family protein [Alphaproteobacteria bacterium]
MKSDRIFGLITLVVALAFIASATQIQTSFLVDPLGPKAFPIMIGAVLVIASLWPIARPDADPEWPTWPRAAKIAICVLVLFGYAFFLRDLGFVLSTAIAAGLISYQIRARAIAAAMIGGILSVSIFVIFKFLLGLGLKAWPAYLMS